MSELMGFYENKSSIMVKAVVASVNAYLAAESGIH
jgi:hypothetical protein